MMSRNVNESNILLCGSPRVGKSSLINAICQETLSKSSESLNSVTKSIDQYSFESSCNNLVHKTTFWDTPGIESWNENDIRNYVSSLIEKTDPICMIYCASPGSFASLESLDWIVSECYKKNIFCALVCTNMWSGRNRKLIIDEFRQVLENIDPYIESKEEDGIIYYSNVALVTMVNSSEYNNEDFGVIKPESGIDELIFGIAKCLQRDCMFAWLRTVSHNKSFWNKMSSKLNDLLRIPYDKFNTLCQHAENFYEYIFSFSITPTKDMDGNTFHDPEMSEDGKVNSTVVKN